MAQINKRYYLVGYLWPNKFEHMSKLCNQNILIEIKSVYNRFKRTSNNHGWIRLVVRTAACGQIYGKEKGDD